MATRSEYKVGRTAFVAVPPGETLREELRARGMRQKECAAAIGMLPSHLSELIRGRIRLTPSIADRLERALGIPAIVWVNMQTQYDYDVKALAARETLATESATARLFSEAVAAVADDVRIRVDLSFAIATRIATLLEERGMTQRDLAHLVGQREGDVAYWLGGTHNFTLATIAKISAALGSSIIEVAQ